LQAARPLVPAVPSVLTLHNIGYQGVFADDVLEDYGLAELRGSRRTISRPSAPM
jgi:glycogen synthase